MISQSMMHAPPECKGNTVGLKYTSSSQQLPVLKISRSAGHVEVRFIHDDNGRPLHSFPSRSHHDLYEAVRRRVEHEDSPKVSSVGVIHELFERLMVSVPAGRS
jgi:hypothetical protein